MLYACQTADLKILQILLNNFRNTPKNDRCGEIRKLLIPKTLGEASKIRDTLTSKDNVPKNAIKSATSLKNLTNTALLKSSSITTITSKTPNECAEKKLEKKSDKLKCLRPVSRIKLVDEPPDDCNVRKAEMPTVKLRDGYVMPMFGLGTWGVSYDWLNKKMPRNTILYNNQ